MRNYNSGTRAAPYESLMVADIGDVNVNMYDLKDTCRRIREAYRKILATGCIPLTMGENAREEEGVVLDPCKKKVSWCFHYMLVDMEIPYYHHWCHGLNWIRHIPWYYLSAKVVPY